MRQMNTESNKSFWSYILPVIKPHVLAELVLIVFVLISPSAWGEEEKAEFSIHLFQNGLPIEDAQLSITSEASGRTNEKLIFEAVPSEFKMAS